MALSAGSRARVLRRRRAYAADELFSEIHEIGVRDGADWWSTATTSPDVLDLDHDRGVLNPPVVYERERGWFTTEPFSEPEIFTFPEGIDRCSASTSSTRSLLMPRWIDTQRVTFK